MHPMLSVGSFGIFQCFILFFSCQALWMDGHGIYLWTFFLVLFALGSLMPVAGAFLPDNREKFLLQGFGNIFLGYALYYAAFLVFFKILRRILWCFQKNVPGVLVFVISLVLTLIVGTYGMVHAQQTKVTTLNISLPKAGGEGQLKAALIADLHLSVNTRYATIERMVRVLNAEKPDVVFFGGDMFTSSYQALDHPQRYAWLLSQIEAPYGVYGVYGNHDVEETLFGGFACNRKKDALRSQEMEQFFKRAGIHVLEDELITLGDTNVQVAGRLDEEKVGDKTLRRKSAGELLATADEKAPILVLQHEPTGYEELKKSGADLVMSGHTHRGQIFPGNLIVPFFNENAYGHKQIHGLDTVVTSGVGYYGPPMRIGTDSEVMILNLSFGEGEKDEEK